MPVTVNGTDEETELAANCLWLITNSKNCPNCKSPIQKNEGCNHMKCSKVAGIFHIILFTPIPSVCELCACLQCKHDFCWVCLEAWKKHSSATGGYFRCNRYEVVRKVEESTDRLKVDVSFDSRKIWFCSVTVLWICKIWFPSQAEQRNQRMQELNKFLHYYTRFKNHENSYSVRLSLICECIGVRCAEVSHGCSWNSLYWTPPNKRCRCCPE